MPVQFPLGLACGSIYPIPESSAFWVLFKQLNCTESHYPPVPSLLIYASEKVCRGFSASAGGKETRLQPETACAASPRPPHTHLTVSHNKLSPLCSLLFCPGIFYPPHLWTITIFLSQEHRPKQMLEYLPDSEKSLFGLAQNFSHASTNVPPSIETAPLTRHSIHVYLVTPLSGKPVISGLVPTTSTLPNPLQLLPFPGKTVLPWLFLNTSNALGL